MANSNPIKTSNAGPYTEFRIPKEYASKQIEISAITSLDKQDWKLNLIHAIRLDGEALDFNPNPDVENVVLDTGKKLNGKKFSLLTRATRVKSGATGKAPTVSYTLTLKSGDTVIETFSFDSDNTNPARIYSRITFKLDK